MSDLYLKVFISGFLTPVLKLISFSPNLQTKFSHSQCYISVLVLHVSLCDIFRVSLYFASVASGFLLGERR